MEWKGIELPTMREVWESGVAKCETPEEAKQFMERYRAVTVHAESNIAFLIAIYAPSEASRLEEWFGVKRLPLAARLCTFFGELEKMVVADLEKRRPN